MVKNYDRKILREFITNNKKFLKKVTTLNDLRKRVSKYIKKNHLEGNAYMRKFELMICSEILNRDLLPVNNFIMQIVIVKHIVKEMTQEASARLIIRDCQMQELHGIMEYHRNQYEREYTIIGDIYSDESAKVKEKN